MRAYLAVLPLVVAVTGCATIMHGSSQDLGIASTPSTATVTIDNSDRGKTPVITKLSRKDNHVIKIELAGYRPFEATVTKQVSGWVVGNIVFGGVIGLAVDAITGGLYNLNPNQVAGQLAAQSALAVPVKHGVMVFLVARPGDDWQQIATLQRD